jgi:hypothetical protein
MLLNSWTIKSLGNTRLAPKSKPVMVHIRLEKELHQNLQRVTAENGTTLQVEITRRLEASFNVPDRVKSLIQQTVSSVIDGLTSEGRNPRGRRRRHGRARGAEMNAVGDAILAVAEEAKCQPVLPSRLPSRLARSSPARTRS